MSVLIADIIVGAVAGGVVGLVLVVLIVILIIINRFVNITIINKKFNINQHTKKYIQLFLSCPSMKTTKRNGVLLFTLEANEQIRNQLIFSFFFNSFLCQITFCIISENVLISIFFKKRKRTKQSQRNWWGSRSHKWSI